MIEKTFCKSTALLQNKFKVFVILGNLVPLKFWHYENDHLLETCILGFIKCVKKTAMANVLDHRLTGNFFGSSQVDSSSSLQLCLCVFWQSMKH